jgi:hypothetical protein
MNIIIFVHTCAIYEDKRAKKIEETWGANRDNVVFITDNPNSTLKNHIYLGEYNKGVTYHPNTVIKMFQLWLSRYSNQYEWFMMIDDDAFLYIDKLIQFLSFFDKNDNYMIADYLNWVDYNEKFNYSYNSWCSGGPGIVFTKGAIDSFMKMIDTISIDRNAVNHDVWLYYHIMMYDNQKNKSIKRIHCPGFHQYGEKELIKKYSKDSNQLISIHLNGNMDMLYEYNRLL